MVYQTPVLALFDVGAAIMLWRGWNSCYARDFCQEVVMSRPIGRVLQVLIVSNHFDFWNFNHCELHLPLIIRGFLI